MGGSKEENVGQQGYGLRLTFLAYCSSSFTFQLSCLLLQEVLSGLQAGCPGWIPWLPSLSCLTHFESLLSENRCVSLSGLWQSPGCLGHYMSARHQGSAAGMSKG